MPDRLVSVDDDYHLPQTVVDQLVLDADIENVLSFDDLPSSGVIVPHRFGMLQWPENAPSGAALSIAAGFPVQETDVYLSADGVLVVGHDNTVDRETNGTGFWSDYPIAGMPQRDSLTSSGVPSLGDGWPVEDCLRFDELLTWAKGKTLINVEPKVTGAYTANGSWKTALNEIHRLCVNTGAMDRVCINSGTISVLNYAISLGFRTIFWGQDTNTALLQQARDMGVWGYDVSPLRTDAEIAYIQSLFDYVVLSPVETRALYARAQSLGLTGVCSDHPGYVGRTTPLVTSTKGATLRGRVLPGCKPFVAAGAPRVVKGKGFILSNSARYFLGELSGTQPSSYKVTIVGKCAQNVTVGETNRQAVNFMFGVPDETTWNGADNIGGYHLILRYSGVLQLAPVSNPPATATVTDTVNTAALTTNGTFTISATVTPTTVQIARDDTAQSGAVKTDSVWRGGYIWIGTNALAGNGEVEISEVKIEPLP